MELKKLIVDLSSLMSIGGFERFEREKLINLVGEHFDDAYLDKVGNQIFVQISAVLIQVSCRRVM